VNASTSARVGSFIAARVARKSGARNLALLS
jgi:hypothetical protein